MMSNSSNLNLVVFDLDNTLVHSQIDYAGMRNAVADLLRAHGVTDETNEQLRRFSVGELIALGAEYDSRNNFEIAKSAWQRVLDFEREGMAKANVDADAVNTLKVLSEHQCKLVILTNNARPAALDALKKFELLEYFDLILSRDDVPMKPDGRGLLQAKSTYHAERIFHVGDAWLDGVAANDADVPFIAFRPLPEAFQGREVRIWKTVQDLSELPKLIL